MNPIRHPVPVDAAAFGLGGGSVKRPEARPKASRVRKPPPGRWPHGPNANADAIPDKRTFRTKRSAKPNGMRHSPEVAA